jgi:hypothetical protein
MLLITFDDICFMAALVKSEASGGADETTSCNICTTNAVPKSVAFYPLKTEKKKPRDLVTAVCVVRVRGLKLIPVGGMAQ